MTTPSDVKCFDHLIAENAVHTSIIIDTKVSSDTVINLQTHDLSDPILYCHKYFIQFPMPQYNNILHCLGLYQRAQIYMYSKTVF